MSAEQISDEKVDNANDIISKDYLIKILEHHHQNKVVLIKYNLASAAAKGENYASVILRAQLDYTIDDGTDDSVKHLSLILKTKSDNAEVDDLLTELSVFQKEIITYTEILSETTKLLQGHGDCTVLSPKLIYYDDKAIVLEDLADKGYRTKNRIERLDLVHSKAVLCKIAKYHAATSIIFKQKPELFKYHLRPPLGNTETILDFFYQNSMKEMIEIVATLPSLQKYVKKLEAFATTMIAQEKSIFKINNNDFCVNNHGDLWINNTLWKYNESGKIEDILLVDHQEGQVCSPGYDLNHFIVTSCNLEVQAQHYDELVAYYHEELTNILKLLGAQETPTLEHIKAGIQATSCHAVIVTAAITAILLIENTEFANAMIFLSDTDEAKFARKQVFSNPRYIEVLELLIPRFANDGVI